MIVTVTLNPAVDEEYLVSNFRLGRWFRAEAINRSPGGKGINVSLMLKQLGYESIAMGFLGGFSGEYIREKLRRAGIITNFVHLREETRTNIFIVDRIGKVETGISEAGPYVDERSLNRFKRDYQRVLSMASMVLLAGSLPPGVPQDIYAELISMAKARGVMTFVETSGAPFKYALEAAPFFAKVDHRFMSELEGIYFTSLDNMIKILERIASMGVDYAVISYKGYGDVFLTPQGLFLAEIPVRELEGSSFGAGDALMAGMLLAFLERMPVEEAIRFAMACAWEDMRHIEKGISSREAVEELVPRVSVERL